MQAITVLQFARGKTFKLAFHLEIVLSKGHNP